ncbi:hypothetical protein Sjap_015707 [Stephania japonica]|uniref:Uncharacterized protein n=1 Tax=Stephania japonica TaxID=461633 RepID=A0AAP0IKG0_9MAGN
MRLLIPKRISKGRTRTKQEISTRMMKTSKNMQTMNAGRTDRLDRRTDLRGRA